MRSVRCDVCGTKALTAASKCPKCGHGFEVRDGFGGLLPLAHCSTCDSYYPESVGSCRWCGTKPDRAASVGPYIWKGFGILTFASLAIGAWFVHNDTPAKPKAPARAFVADTLPTNQPKTVTVGTRKTLAQRDSFGAAPIDSAIVAHADSSRDASVVATTDTTLASPTSVVPTPSEPVAMQSAGTVVQPEPVALVDSTPAALPAPTAALPSAPPPVTASRVRPPARDLSRPPTRAERAEKVTPRTPAKTPARVLARPPERAPVRAPATRTAPQQARVVAKLPVRAAASPKSVGRSKAVGRWVSSVARNWAVVRADPSRQSRIIAAIGPNTRVQLGETRGAWRRIKAKGLAGWVEHRTLLARLSAPKKAGRLAAR
jgi:SH3 domain-containing protein